MFPILWTKQLASDVKRLRIRAPLVARRREPGQFVIVRVDGTGERIPLTIADANREAGTIDLIVKAIGKTTICLCSKEAGDSIPDVAGPLGKPTELLEGGHAVLVGGGVGTAVVYPLAQALREAGCYVSAITGGRTHEFVLLEEELAAVADVVYPCTDDGSYGFHGTVAAKLLELIEEDSRPIGAVYSAGPVPMMRAVAEATRPRKIRTVVSLNPVMVDGTGMCGGCRVKVGGKVLYACVDGPEFDGHEVDFAELWSRLSTYRTQEQESLDRLHKCKSEAALEEATCR
jgi:ferredoxin--NADP+ reductase